MPLPLPRERNQIFLDENYAEIGLTRGFVTSVSIKDFDRLLKFSWAFHRGVQDRAVRYVGRETVYMHHDVLGVTGAELKTAGLEADHINRITLDNRRENLRIVTHYENMKNTDRHTKRVGYMLHKPSGLWFSYVNYPNHVVVSLGYYKTMEKAMAAASMGRKLQETGIGISEFKEKWIPMKNAIKALP